MNYYLNEYSLRGQFRSIEEFFDSLREKTLPVLKKIGSENGSVIFKKDTFWTSEICSGISLNNIPEKKNERTVERSRLKSAILSLICSEPYWTEWKQCEVDVRDYKFDEAYRQNFSEINCFTETINNEGRIVSFAHEEYAAEKLGIVICKEDKLRDIELDNISSVKWWEKEPQIRSWHIDKKYLVEVRAKEFDYHPPHFHVSKNGTAAVFRLCDGELYRPDKSQLPMQFMSDVRNWYLTHVNELQTAWEDLHKKMPYG